MVLLSRALVARARARHFFLFVREWLDGSMINSVL
jgi:hypothetical protein